MFALDELGIWCSVITGCCVMAADPEETPNWHQRANLLLSLQVPRRYRYLITPALLEEGAEILRKGQTFEVHLNHQRLGRGFDTVTADGIGELPGVTAEGISAKGLITLVPKTK